MRLFLIRHAESELNRDRTNVGGRSSWCELSERGLAQARALGRRMRREEMKFDRFISSTAVRAQQTARWALSEYAEFPLWRLESSPVLEEVFYGDFEGRPRHLSYTQETLERLRADPWTFAPPNGESLAEASERARAFFDDLAESSPGRRVGVVSHGMVIRAALTTLLGTREAEVLEWSVRNTSIHELELGEAGWSLVRQNDTQHLDDDGVEGLPGNLNAIFLNPGAPDGPMR
ncbi:MAG: histidine phosphatase family protein [Myxococcota bacterium]